MKRLKVLKPEDYKLNPDICEHLKKDIIDLSKNDSLDNKIIRVMNRAMKIIEYQESIMDELAGMINDQTKFITDHLVIINKDELN